MDISPQRRKVAVLGGSLAAMSAALSAISHRHPRIAAAGLAVVGLLLVYTVVEFSRLKRGRRHE